MKELGNVIYCQS